MRSVALAALRLRVTRLEAHVDVLRESQAGRASPDYARVLGELLKAREALMLATDPAMAAYLS